MKISQMRARVNVSFDFHSKTASFERECPVRRFTLANIVRARVRCNRADEEAGRGERNGEESEGSRGNKDRYHSKTRVVFVRIGKQITAREREKGRGGRDVEEIRRDRQRGFVKSAFDFRVSICMFRRRSTGYAIF